MPGVERSIRPKCEQHYERAPGPHTHQTRRARISEGKVLAAVLAESFADDPVVSHLLRDSKQSDAWAKYFEIGVEVAFEQREVWTTDELTGACLFVAPNRWRISTWKELKSAWRISRATSLATTLEIRAVFHLLEGALPKAPHDYLLAIGVRATHRNRGVGHCTDVSLAGPLPRRTTAGLSREHRPEELSLLRTPRLQAHTLADATERHPVHRSHMATVT